MHVMNCNVVFNNLYIDMLDDMIKISDKNKDIPDVMYTSAEFIRSSRDGWRTSYLDMCGGIA